MNDVLTNAAAAVGGIVIAVVVSLGIVSTANGTPKPVEEPLVTYGER